MPELPEVETTTKSLSMAVTGLKIVDFWTDTPNRASVFINKERFIKVIKSKKIKKVERVGKNIIFQLSGNISLLAHQKISGHFLFGEWFLDNKEWKSKDKNLSEKTNLFLRFVFTFNNGKMMALSDPRKFAKLELWQSDKLKDKLDINIGPDATKVGFTVFKKRISSRGSIIKKILMDQSIISGIGNIYSDEILWDAKINPYKRGKELKEKELKKIFHSSKKILLKSIELKGDSMSDYRLIDGTKGSYQNNHKVYKRENLPCPRKDKGIIIREKIGNRSLRFCPICQK
jgi:formamidopyrimidine-DNA glycosylase